MLTTEERFWQKVEINPDGCWNWTGSTTKGYGQFGLKGRLVYAHRYSYQTLVGEVPSGLELDHLCRNRQCVNPQHLEEVTHSVNIKRGLGPSISRQRQLSKTHCPSGHPYDNTNTYVTSQGKRHCRACHTLRERQRRS